MTLKERAITARKKQLIERRQERRNKFRLNKVHFEKMKELVNSDDWIKNTIAECEAWADAGNRSMPISYALADYDVRKIFGDDYRDFIETEMIVSMLNAAIKNTEVCNVLREKYGIRLGFSLLEMMDLSWHKYIFRW